MPRPSLTASRRSLLVALGLTALLPEAAGARDQRGTRRGRRCPDPAGGRHRVDLRRDPANCGRCGHACADSETCRDGTCAAAVCNQMCGVCHSCVGGTCQPLPDGSPCGDGTCRAGTCESADPDSACGTVGPSGVAGIVLVGPTCPVQRVDDPCPDRPLAATLLVRDAAGRPVCTTASGGDGRFRAALPAGDYVLDPGPSNLRWPRGSATAVTVPGGRWVEAVVAFDSGIR